jgi:exodeoxyribonuclease VII large subunit
VRELLCYREPHEAVCKNRIERYSDTIPYPLFITPYYRPHMNHELDFSAEPSRAPADTRDIYTPARLNREARTLLDRGFGSLWLEGELSNFSRPASGHWYFSLKDEAAQLRSAMFRQRNLLVNFAPKDGMHVLVRGRVSLYEPRGDYQFIAEYMEEAGEGALRRRFEQLKAKLAAAGLFAAEHKQPLPALPRRIGVITSPTGAAIRDILHILRRRFPSIPVLIYPVPVQGAGAAELIAAAIRLADERADCDVLILARGGGSLEDLWSFNEEVVARAIFDCRIPLITGVGHEVDFTIADFVADVRAPTPSGAAELVTPDRETWLQGLYATQRRLTAVLRRLLGVQQQRFEWLKRRLNQLHPGVQLRQRAQRLDELEQRLLRALQFNLEQRKRLLGTHMAQLQQLSPALRLAKARSRLNELHHKLQALILKRYEQSRSRLALATRSLNTLSPLATLTRGYAIVTDSQGHVVVAAGKLSMGETISARLAQGNFVATVNKIERNEK